jgi:hypothetical protein
LNTFRENFADLWGQMEKVLESNKALREEVATQRVELEQIRGK